MFPVNPFGWSHWRKHHFLIDQTLLSGIVMLNAIVIIVHAATAHISGSSNSRPTGTTADDFEFFVSFADPVVNAVVFQNIPGEDWFSFIGFDAGWGDGVCCFHIAIAMIYSNDFGVSEFSHKKYLRFRID